MCDDKAAGYTYQRSGSIIQVDNNPGPESGPLQSTRIDAPQKLSPVLFNGGDPCGPFQFINSSGECSASPLTDARDPDAGDRQCRTVCQDYDFSQYEVVRIFTLCNYCASLDAARWFSESSDESKYVCIPRSTCIEQCGAAGHGCVYSGSCQTRICFSGIDAKRPAQFTRLSDDGSESELSVDNSGALLDEDPPVFGRLGQEGNATSVPREPPQTSPPSTTTFATSSSVAEHPSTTGQSPATDPVSTTTPPTTTVVKNGVDSSTWRWLGPLIGVLAGGLLLMCVIVFCVCRANLTIWH